MEDLIGAVVGSFLGAALASVMAWRRLRVEGTRWQMDAVVRGMGFLTGGRQERSAGIGIIEALIKSSNVPDNIRPGVDNVMWNQLVYVVYHGDIDKRHERVNAERLIALIRESPDPTRISQYSPKALDEMAKRVETA